eukprot:scaffold229177_cov32-Tisochrysis_lutea.AAC.1
MPSADGEFRGDGASTSCTSMGSLSFSLIEKKEGGGAGGQGHREGSSASFHEVSILKRTHICTIL